MNTKNGREKKMKNEIGEINKTISKTDEKRILPHIIFWFLLLFLKLLLFIVGVAFVVKLAWLFNNKV